MTTKGKFRIKGLNRQQQIVWGAFCILIAILLFAAFTSFFKTWKIDQSAIGAPCQQERQAQPGK